MEPGFLKHEIQSSSKPFKLPTISRSENIKLYLCKKKFLCNFITIYTSLVFLICLSSKIGGALFFIQLPIYDMYYITMYILLCINEELMANPDFFVDNIACESRPKTVGKKQEKERLR